MKDSWLCSETPGGGGMIPQGAKFGQEVEEGEDMGKSLSRG